MASQGQQFPPQQQESQPGKEHAMDPRPEAITQHYKSANKLQGKVAIVTGGDSGIGRAVCLCFALEGATVAFTYVKGHEDKDAEETLQALRDIKGRTGARDPMAVPADLGYEENCRKVVEEVASAYGGRVDVLVNNAAEQYERPCITDITEEGLERVFRSNIFSYVFMSKHALKHMARGGSIINTSSFNAYKGNKTLLDYTATKGAIGGVHACAGAAAGGEGHPRERRGAGAHLDAAHPGVLLQGEGGAVRRRGAHEARRPAHRGRAQLRLPRQRAGLLLHVRPDAPRERRCRRQWLDRAWRSSESVRM